MERNHLAPRAAQLAGCVPIVYYAVWSTPDADGPAKAVRPSRARRRGYWRCTALWHASLRYAGRPAWDEFLAKCTADAKLLGSSGRVSLSRRTSRQASGKQPRRRSHAASLFIEALSNSCSAEADNG